LEQAIQKADTLIEALAWIRHFRDKVTVIKLGGSVMEDPDALHDTCCSTSCSWKRSACGPSSCMAAARRSAGRWRTPASLRASSKAAATPTPPRSDIVERCWRRTCQRGWPSEIEELGGRAAAAELRTTNVLFGERLTARRPDGEPIDLGTSATVTSVDRQTIENLCYAGQVPVIPSMCIDRDGQKLQRQRRHGRHGRRPGARRREAGVPERRQRRARDKNDPSLIHSLTASTRPAN
jgi:acetylglutamate kinase